MLPYSKSALCALLIDEAADVAVEIHTIGAAWALNPCPGGRDFGYSSIEGEKNSPDFGFSISPLIMSRSTLTVNGFSMSGRSHGPEQRGRLLMSLHIWATSNISRLTLATDKSATALFCFGGSDQLLTQEPAQFLVKPWENGAGGTPFDWPSA
ncbi:hypothetical protein [Trinickia dinghuensis]|uniref:hypothetical protein n=1 Tax=Trinickia dinghuensis TaxID=2291023 RepID=UPI0011C029F6|nr:hypothetical protein [Trinickia dinghuensis]